MVKKGNNCSVSKAKQIKARQAVIRIAKSNTPVSNKQPPKLQSRKILLAMLNLKFWVNMVDLPTMVTNFYV